MELRFIDLFCGIGGFRLGLEKASIESHKGEHQTENARCGDGLDIGWNGKQASYQCVWSNDNDRYACQIYRKHWGEVCEQDIRTVDPSTIPEHNLLCAGFPCQSFSIAGKRGGFEDTRGTLFFEICRIAGAKRTPYLLLENVKGLLSHDNGDTFQTILGTLDELGYNCQWQVLNSKDFGVPQNRERVFIIGHLRGKPRPKVFPIGELYREDNEIAESNETASVRCLGDTARNQSNMTIIRSLQGGGHSGGHHSGMTLIHTAYPDLREYEDISPTISTPSGGGHLPYVLDDYNRRVKEDGIVPTIRQTNASNALGNASKLIEGSRIRRLTPLECERLQGFPDGWTEGISDTQRYKCLGNAVTTNVIEAIGRQWLKNVLY